MPVGEAKRHATLGKVGGGLALLVGLAATAGSCTTSSKRATATPVPISTSTFTATPVPLSIGLLAVGGWGGNASYSTAEFYNATTNSWTSVASMLTARHGLAAAPVTIGGVAGVLAVGGGDSTTTFSTAEFYNPVSNTWSTMAFMQTGRGYLAAAPVTIGGVVGVLAVGGTGSGVGLLSSAEFYDPISNSWAYVASMPTARYQLAAAPVVIGGVAGVLVVGGSNGTTLSTAEFYNPGTDSWFTMASLLNASQQLTAAPVTIGAVGGVLAIGGNPTEFYDPGTDSWSTTAPMPNPSADLAAAPVTIGGVGGVLAIGGAAAEFYNPGNNSWSAMAPMLIARLEHAAAH